MWGMAEAERFAESYKDVFEITSLSEIIEDLKKDPYFVDKFRCLDNEDGDERWQAESDLLSELEDTAILVKETYEWRLNAGYSPSLDIHRCLWKYHDLCEKTGTEPNDLRFLFLFEQEEMSERHRRMEY